MKKLRQRQAGFTIVELMIATAVFSMVLLLMAVAITQIGKAYYRGSIVNRAQGVTRSVVDEVAQVLQFSTRDTNIVLGSGSITLDGQQYPTHAYCIGSVRYTYILDRPLGADPATQSPFGLWRDVKGGGECTANIEDGESGQELLGENMRLVKFMVCSSEGTDCPATKGSDYVSIVVAYGDDDGFADEEHTICKSTSFGGQFCAVSEMATGVTRRLP